MIFFETEGRATASPLLRGVVITNISSKQDRARARTTSDIERKYNFGKTFAEVFDLISDAQTTADEAKKAIDNLDHEQIFNLLTDYGRVQGVYRGDDGNVYINATYIKSGKLAAEFIDADNLTVKSINIDGEITFEQLSSGVQGMLKNPVELPDYIKGTYIDSVKIQSPTITGNQIRALQAFSVGLLNGTNYTPRGNFGLAYGKDADENMTYGVAMSNASSVDNYGVITYDAEGRYVIITDSGVRLQSFDNNIALTKNNIYLSIKDAQDQRLNWIHLNASGAFYNDKEILTEELGGVVDLVNSDGVKTGWFSSCTGEANESDGTTTETLAVALASSETGMDANGKLASTGRYVMVSTEGVKLRSGENTRITLTDNVISVRALNGKQFQYNGSEVVTKDMLRAWGVIS